MNDESVPDDALSAILERAERLDAKRRLLLEALLRKTVTEADRGTQRRGPVGDEHQETHGHPGRRAARDSERATGPSPSPLITMRSTGSRIPFFCVHALLGSVFHYHRLAAAMDADQPFYALQAPGLDGTDAPLDTVDAFARLYVEAVRKVRPKGPYRFGGYSFGSWIAFQMASQLIDQGETVDLVAILGTDVPFSVSMPAVHDEVSFLLEYFDAFRKNIVQPFLSYEERVKQATRRRGRPAGTPLLDVTMAHNKAALRFEPKPQPVRLALFETVDQQIRSPFDPSRGWKRLTTKGVETYLVSGNHLNMLDEPHVHDLATKMTECLNRT
jgi:thioesterase domain-containing protein